MWRFSAGEPIVESPAVIDDRVYVTTQVGGMYSLDVKTGHSRWFAENVMRFIAASKTRVYATDDIGRLLVLSAGSGARLDTIPTEGASFLANADTDRIYMIGKDGLIQCFHEVEQTRPLVHNAERRAAAKAGLTPPKPEKEFKPEKPAQREHVVPKALAIPKEHTVRPKREPKPKTPRQPRPRRGKRGDAGDVGNPADQPGGPFGPAKGRAPKKKNDNNPFGGGKM